MSQYKLMLYPVLPTGSKPETGIIISVLKDCGLISGEKIHDHYLAGKSFLELLTFLGCAPNICLTPQESVKYCHIVIRPVQPVSHCLGYTATATPRCPNCKNKIPHWKQIQNHEQGATVCVCRHCQATTAMQDLNWKQECAYGCMAIEIINIHPFEAVPSENLLQALHDATGTGWNYSYAFDK